MGFRLSAQFVRYAIVGALGMSIGGAGGVFAAALIPDANGIIHGCYDAKTGALRVVGSAGDCSKREVPIQWNERGVAGATGAAGPAGATGATGATGPAGGAIASLNSLNGLPCGADGTGATRIVYSAGNVAILCDAPDLTSPTISDAHMLNNPGSTDFSDVGDAFSLTFSERMNGTSSGSISLQDQDGSTATVLCGPNASCLWNVATDTVTVALTKGMPSGGGFTPGLQIPMNVVFLGGFADAAGNAPNVLGSPDQLIDY